MRKNDEIIGIVDALGANCEGIVHVDGTTVFVPFVLPNEKISVKVLKIKGNVAYGKAIRVFEPSKDRVEPVCPVFGKCGGCNLQHLAYEKQLGYKAEAVETCFRKIAGLNVSVGKTFPSPEPFGYRNKLQLPIRENGGKAKIGFFREGSHDVVEIDDCPLQPDWAKSVIASVKDILAKGVPAYDETNGKGLLRHVVVREINGEFLFTFVFAYQTKKHDNELIAALLSRFEKFSVLININSYRNNVILGDAWRKVYGSGEIEVDEFGIVYPVNAASFLQVNTPVKKMIYESVLCNSEINKDAVVIDAYSGAGVLTAMLAKRAKKAYGVEIVAEAVEAADKLKNLNGITNMENICAPCEKVLPDLIKNVRSGEDKVVLVLDPPRSGVDAATLSSILSAPPNEIIYVSCSPQTLARDVGVLVGTLKVEDGKIVDGNDNISRYRVADVSIYDMFPQTKHVECVTLITKK